MGNLMPQYNGQRGLILGDRQDALIDTDQSTRHTPGIHLIVLHEIELPLVVLQIVLQTCRGQIVGDGIGQVLAYPFYHRRIGGIRREFGTLHEILILLSGEAEDITIAHHQTLLTPCNGHCVGRTAADEHCSHQ